MCLQPDKIRQYKIMAISRPNKNLLSVVDVDTSGATTVSYPFTVPQDSNGIVVRVYNDGLTTVTNDIYVQTSEDAGTNWRDCVHFTQQTAALPVAQAEWAVVGTGASSGGTGNLMGWVGSVQASMLAAGRNSGLPLMGTYNRVYIVYGGGSGTNTGTHVDVYSNSQSSDI
jgi:hypothetical protein